MRSYCYVYVLLLLYMFRSGYSVSLCCSVYCWCVNMYCTTVSPIAVNRYIILKIIIHMGIELAPGTIRVSQWAAVLMVLNALCSNITTLMYRGERSL